MPPQLKTIFPDEESPLLQASEARAFNKATSNHVRIAIVGGGVAGIVASRVLKARGFSNFVILEATDKLSGVWSTGYPNAGIQTPGKLYEFPDKELPAPKDYKSLPEIRQYCEDYVAEHGLNEHVRLNAKVTSIQRSPDFKWLVTTNHSSVEAFDFVILATGVYSPNHKFIPQVEGIEHFQGRICHSQDTWNDKALDRQGKRVIVVGFGKSAQDCAMNAYYETGTAPVLLFRAAHWCVPRKVLGLIPMEYLIYSRFGQGTLPQWQEWGPVEWFFQTCTPIIWLYWRIVEVLFSLQLGLYGSHRHLRPTLNIQQDMYCGHGVICHPEMFPMMRQGKIDAIQGSIQRITPEGKVELIDGQVLEADEIVFATGFKRIFDFLPKELLARKEDDGFYAYRNMVVPGVPNLAFLNSNVTTFSNITTPGIQAAWIAELLKGRMEIPADFEEVVAADKAWRRQHLTHAGESRAFLIQLHQIRYWDALLRDMGIDVKRKTSKFGPVVTALQNLFLPVYSSDYKTVITGECDPTETRPQNYVPSFVWEWCVLAASVGLCVAGVQLL